MTNNIYSLNKKFKDDGHTNDIILNIFIPQVHNISDTYNFQNN